MRMTLTAALLPALVTGCGLLAREDVSTGWRFEVNRPPTMHVASPAILSQQGGAWNLQTAPMAPAPCGAAFGALQQGVAFPPIPGAPLALPGPYLAPVPACEMAEVLRRLERIERRLQKGQGE